MLTIKNELFSTKEHSDSFFMAMKPCLFLGQAVGLIPLSGVMANDHRQIHLSWLNWKVAYAGVILFTSIFFNYVSTLENIRDGIRIDQFGSTVYYTVCNLNSILFISLSRQMPKLFRKIAKMEESMSEYGHTKSLSLRIKIFLSVFVILCVFEHSLLTFLTIRGSIITAEEEKRPFLKVFSEQRFTVIMNALAYSDATVIFVFVVNVICTMNWNYLDFFLVCLCLSVHSKFEQINDRLAKMQGKAHCPEFWRKISTDYNNISLLTKQVDAQFSKLILISYVSNLYHLSLQLLRSLKFKGDRYAMTYFYFSMIYLMLRTLAVSLSAAWIEETSKVPKKVIYSLRRPSSGATRLLNQAINDDIYITGKQFFIVDRKFILILAGTLATYEVVLIQLNSLRFQETTF